ncbi:MAG: hypothetical protein HN576_02380 [Bacteriovoracaceae bacterium]|jgi:pilus assembly protein CpaC|nr:hypothetical protein [Bacteriovoracaceae bacterium]
MLKTFNFILILLLSSFYLNVNAQDKTKLEEKSLEVVLGIDKIVKLDFVLSRQKQVQIGNESALSYQILPSTKEIVFKGLKPGKTSVTLRSTVGDIKVKYLVNVTTNDQSKIVKELRDFLDDVEGLEIGIKGEYVYVGGKIVVPNDIGRVVVILDKYPDVIRLVELSPQTQRVIAKKMQDEIQKAGMRDVTVRIVNSQFWLEGVVTNKGEPERAQRIANSYVPDQIQSLAVRTDSVQTARRNIIENFIQLNEKKKKQPAAKLIKITAQFVELTRDYNKIFGFKWTPTLGGDGGSINLGRGSSGDLTTNSSNTLSATISNLFPKLASAKSAGHARVIQSGVVLVKDGQSSPSTIRKESEKPFAIGTGEFLKSEKAKSGFNLQVSKPKVLPEENIEMGLGISVSATIGNPPETIANSISTFVLIKNKETAVVGGIVINKTATDFDRDPPGGVDTIENGQPLFSFIKSKSYITSRNQFVVFVTPEIIESASQGTEEIKKKFRQRTR